jgi:DNA-binding transcriptional LysR family regulator
MDSIQFMQQVNLSAIDLNLLVVLEALLSTRSTTQAGRLVSLSQPATSHALARLRDLLGDPLLVRSGRSLVPTPFADGLLERVQAALRAVSSALEVPTPFDPRASRRLFEIGSGDYVASVLAPPLSAHLARHAPHIDLFYKPVTAGGTESLLRGDVELVIAPQQDSRGIVVEELFRDSFVCLVRAGHPLGRARLTLDRFCEMGHVLVAPGGLTRSGIVDGALSKIGRERRVAVTVPHFLVAPLVVARSDLVLTLAGKVAQSVAPQLGLRILQPPLKLDPFDISMHWHKRLDRDPAHMFLRDAVRAAAKRTR